MELCKDGLHGPNTSHVEFGTFLDTLCESGVTQHVIVFGPPYAPAITNLVAEMRHS